MNILIVNNTGFPLCRNKIRNGVSKDVLYQYDIFKEYGHNVKMLTTDDSDKEFDYYGFYSDKYDKDKEVIRNSINLYNTILDYIIEYNIEAVFYHIDIYKLTKLIADYSRMYNVPMVIFNHHAASSKMYYEKICKAYKYAVDKGCITVSPSNYCKESYNKVIDGCVTDKCPFPYIEEEMYMDISLERNGHVISASRIDSDMLENISVKAFNLSGKDCEFYGTLIGYYKPFFNEKIKPYLNDKVKYFGNIPHSELLKVFASSSLLVHPVHYDAYPNVVAEALSCGLPVMPMIKKHECGSVELLRDIGVYDENLILDVYRMREDKAAKFVYERIDYFFNSEYNTLDYRKEISQKSREFFNKKNFYKRHMDLIDKARSSLQESK